MAIDFEQRIAELERQLAERTRERDGAHAREQTVASVLRLLSASPADQTAVFRAILDAMERLLGSGTLWLRDGDMIRLDADAGTLEVLVDAKEFAMRQPVKADLSRNQSGTGRELFAAFRSLTGRADQGASIFEVA